MFISASSLALSNSFSRRGAIATFGISWKRLGFDLGLLPVGVVTGNFRFDIDF
jgi:hypothetical protein